MGRVVYFVKEAFRGIVQAKLMTSVSVIAIAVSLFLLGTVVIAVLNVRQLLSRALDGSDLIVYVDDSIGGDPERLENLLSATLKLSAVDSGFIVTRDQARERFVALYGAHMLEAVEGNPLPASIELRLRSEHRQRESADSVTVRLQEMAGVESVQFSSEWFERLSRFKDWMLGAAVIMSILCIIVLNFIVSNTVKLTIYARKDLVINMRYVGATNLYIAVPFVLEGIIQGLMGALVAAGFLAAVELILHRYLVTWGSPWLLPLLVMVGVFFGFMGSIGAVRRFLT